MKKLTTLSIVTLLAASTLVFASGEHDNSGTMQMGSMPMSDQSSMMGMSPEMQGKMTKMRADMMSIQQEKDPAKRKALMHAHMQDMKGMMGMMKDKRAMMQAKHMDQMKQLETRVTMMESMMEQIMDTHITALDPDDPVYRIDSMD